MRLPLFEIDLDALPTGNTIDWAPRGNPLSVMLKLSPDAMPGIWALDECAMHRPAGLLHTTIQPVGDRSWITDRDIEATKRILSRVRYAPFLLLFDRVEGGETMTLRGGNQNCVAQDFRLAILDALSSHFRWLPGYRLDPYMTLDDRSHGRPGRMLAQPIAWFIEEFALVESSHGGTCHIEHGRWRLRED